MRLAAALCLVALTVGCVGEDDTDTDAAVDTDTDSDSDSDSDTDSDTTLDFPCPDVAGVLPLPGSFSGTLSNEDPEQWTGMGDLPVEVLAIELVEDQAIQVELLYPEPNTGTSTKYWMRANFVRPDCSLVPVGSSNGGDADNDRVTLTFLPPESGQWYLQLYFSEAMVQPGSISYEATATIQ